MIVLAGNLVYIGPLLRLCVSLLPCFIYPKTFIISYYFTIDAQMAHDCQILCFSTV